MKATIDRIDQGIAILIDREDDTLQFRVPVSLLPPASREGDILSVTFERDGAGTKEAKEKVSGLIQELRKCS